MITGELKSQVDRLWDAFWAGGIANPLEVIEQITYLLFIKRLDESSRTDLSAQIQKHHTTQMKELESFTGELFAGEGIGSALSR